MILLALSASAAPSNIADRVAATAEARASRLGKGAPEIPAEVYSELDDGSVQTGLVDVPGSKARKAWGVAVVDVPVGALFSAINDDRNKVEITKLSHNSLVEGEFCGSRRVVFQYLPVPIITDRWWIVELRINESVAAATDGRVREMVWSMVDNGVSKLGPADKAIADGGMSVASTYGGWFLVDLDGSHTLIEFWSYADPGGSVPVRLVQSFSSGGIADSIEGMVGLAKRGPSCSL